MQEDKGKLDLLISGGTLLTMESGAEALAASLIGIKDGRIALVAGAQDSFGPPPEAGERIDATGCLILPGLVNTHTHLAMTLFRGLADDLPLMAWLNDHIFPAERRFINPETVYLGSLLAMAEMLLSGTTTFCDGYFHEGAVGRATLTAGMRGVIAQGFIDLPIPDGPSPGQNEARAEAFLDAWQSRSPLVTPGLVCHSAYTCSPKTLQEVKNAARRCHAPYLIHLSETAEEVALVEKHYGKRPVRHLSELGVLDDRTVAAHCIWLDEMELDLLAGHGVKVAHDPESNMKLAAGVAPVPAMLSRGIEVGLGTDGCASNNDLDLFGEMGMCARIHKVVSGDPTVLDARRVVEMATIGGARALGLAERTGSITPGKEADLILVDARRPHGTPLYNPYSHLVYSASGADVRTSIIAGRVVMRDRKISTFDVEELLGEVRRIAAPIASARGCMTTSKEV